MAGALQKLPLMMKRWINAALWMGFSTRARTRPPGSRSGGRSSRRPVVGGPPPHTVLRRVSDTLEHGASSSRCPTADRGRCSAGHHRVGSPRRLWHAGGGRAACGFLSCREVFQHDVQGSVGLRRAVGFGLHLPADGALADEHRRREGLPRVWRLRRRLVHRSRTEERDADGRPHEARRRFLRILRARRAGLQRELLQAWREVARPHGASVLRGRGQSGRRRMHGAGRMPGEVHDLRVGHHHEQGRRPARPADRRLYPAGPHQS